MTTTAKTERMFKATLVRGETFFHRDLKFYKGQAQSIPESTKKKLEKSAVDRYTMQGPDGKEVEVKQKFKFELIQGASGKAPLTPEEKKALKLKELQAMQGEELADDYQEGDGEVIIDETEADESTDDDVVIDEDAEAPVTKPAAAKAPVKAPPRKR